jgi:hypothetical protein
MNTNDLNALLERTFVQMKALSSTKGEEYAGTEDRLSNFKRLADELEMTPEQVLMVYLTKHLDSIRTYIKDKASGRKRELSEPIAGRIDDAILYLILLKGLVYEREEKERGVSVRSSLENWDPT